MKVKVERGHVVKRLAPGRLEFGGASSCCPLFGPTSFVRNENVICDVIMKGHPRMRWLTEVFMNKNKKAENYQKAI